MAESIENYYMVWGPDQAPYGPVQLSTLASWISDGRVTAESWIFDSKTGDWRRAKKFPELKSLFGRGGDTTCLGGPPRIDPQVLRRIRLLAALTDAHLETIAGLVEVERVPTGALIIGEGQRDDCLYLILEGELRVSLSVPEKGGTLTMLRAGDFCGEVAMLDRGARSANVQAATNCLLARLPAAALDRIFKSGTDMAASFLHALDEALSERIRADNERFTDLLRARRSPGEGNRPPA